MNLITKLNLFILLVHLPSFHFLFMHHHCTFSPSWSVNITNLRVIRNNETKERDSSIVEPMNLTRGNITLVTLLDASESIASDQAKKFSVMLNFLKSNGLNKISFIIINSANSTAYFDQLRQNVNNSDIHMFQDTEMSKVWQLLNGKPYDVFVYNRCGNIVYHISYPLSILGSNEPIVQATLLATYYEDLCSGCQLNGIGNGTNETSSSLNKIEYQNVIDGRSKTNYTSRTGREETNEESLENHHNRTVFTTTINNKTNFNKDYYSSKGEILKNSNSTINVSDIFIDKDQEQKMNKNSSYLFYSPWQLFKYFLNKSDSTFNLSQQQSNLTNNSLPVQESTVELVTGNSLSKGSSTILSNDKVSTNYTMTNEMTITSGSNVSSNVRIATSFSNNELFNASFRNSTENTSSKQTEMSFDTKINLSTTTSNLTPLVNSTENALNGTDTTLVKTNKCAGYEINCSEFSIDKMLAVRLCCLNGNSILSTGSGCRKFDRTKCDKVSPIIRCCLRSLSEILDDYFAKNGSKHQSV